MTPLNAQVPGLRSTAHWLTQAEHITVMCVICGRYGVMTGILWTMYYMAKHSLMGALGWGPRYTITSVKPCADRGLRQVGVI